MSNFFLDKICKIDELAMIMLALIFYMGICVMSFAARYMRGDRKYRSFFFRLTLLIFSVATMVTSDNFWLLLISLCFGNLLVLSLMIHKPKWKTAKASGVMVAKNYLLSIICMGGAFFVFYSSTGETKISSLTPQNSQSMITTIGLLLLLVGAMAQSAIWPFHRWILSSLNSPTPVSAIMHAGLVNGGGFLLARFSQLYASHHNFMTAIFVIGMISALIGTTWKLMQSDVKRTLACSTLGQMGFMFVQCGLGLFPLAIGHLFFHGMFKAYLFLASGSAAQEKPLKLSYPSKGLSFSYSLVCGALGSFVFAHLTSKSWLAGDSTFVLLVIVFLAGSQLALPILNKPSFKNFIVACISVLIAALVYGGSVQFISKILRPMVMMHAQPLNIFHILGVAILVLGWLCVVFMKNPLKTQSKHSPWLLKAYVKALNSSQPHWATITAHRNHYQY